MQDKRNKKKFYSFLSRHVNSMQKMRPHQTPCNLGIWDTPLICTSVFHVKSSCSADQNIAKGTTHPRVEFSLPKFKHKSWSNFIFRISTKHQLQNLNQTSASHWNLKFKILTKHGFRILTKHQLQNLNQTSRTRLNLILKFKIFTKPSIRILTTIQLHNL